MRRVRAVVAVLVFSAGVGASGGTQPAIEISGTISSTLSLTGDAVLVGDVTCTVVGAPCIRIAAPGVTLSLNGFSMTGLADPVLGCSGSLTANEYGIQVTGQRAIDIRGPGIVRQFRSAGIRIDGASTRVLVRQVTASTNCASGIWVVGGGNHDLEANTAERNGNSTIPCGGIWLAGATRGNRLRANRLSGNGYAEQQNNFGIGLVAAGVNDNTLVDNVVMGNANGIVILSPSAQGNLIRRNLVVGNPPIQISVDHPGTTGVDIRNLAPGVNTLEDNICLTGVNAACPNVDGTPMRLPG